MHTCTCACACADASDLLMSLGHPGDSIALEGSVVDDADVTESLMDDSDTGDR